MTYITQEWIYLGWRKRIVPTHFIEVWKGGTYDIPLPICSLERQLQTSRLFGIKTLFIWKIKLKDVPPDWHRSII